MDWLSVLALVMIANGSPLILARALNDRLAYPLDAGFKATDGHPVFGRSKTIRGLAAGICVPAFCALGLGLEWTPGFAIGVSAMLGDLLSSFTKRRLGLPPSAQTLGLDQVPESLLPALAVAPALDLSLVEVLAVVSAFFGLELVLSRLLFRVRLRKQPY